MQFEWDDAKEAANERKHGVSFGSAMSVFDDPLAATAYDPDHSNDEDRFVTIGLDSFGRVVFVSHTDRGEVVRIISARVATSAERKDYEDGDFP